MKEYIKTYSEQLHLAPKTTELALEYVDMITDVGVGVGRKPSGLAAAMLYLACEERGEFIARNYLATVAGLSQKSSIELYRYAKFSFGMCFLPRAVVALVQPRLQNGMKNKDGIHVSVFQQ